MPKAAPKKLDRIRDPKVIARFLAMVKVESGCWIWQGYTDRKGYGQIKVNGKAHWAHRVAFAIFNEDIPDGISIDHTCHRPGCVHPDHVQTATVAENSRERWTRHEQQDAA